MSHKIRVEQMTVFRPGWRWRALTLVLGFALVAGAAVFAVLAGQATPFLWGLAALCAVLGVVIVWRASLVRLEYDGNELFVAGVLWSRRVELDQIDEIDTAPETAVVRWTTHDGRARVTPLTAVGAGRLGWLPRQARRRRCDFLERFDAMLKAR